MKKVLFLIVLTAMFLVVSCGGDKKTENPDADETVTDEDSADAEETGDNDYPGDTEISDTTSDTSDSTDDSADSSTDDTDSATDTTTPDDDSATSEQDRKQGELYGECYPNNTCNEGLICDVENNICIKDPNAQNDDDNDTPDETTGGDSDTTPEDADPIENSDEINDPVDQDQNQEEPDDNNDYDNPEIVDNDADSGDSTSDDDSDAADSEQDHDSDNPEIIDNDADSIIFDPCESDPCSEITYSTGLCTMTDEGYTCGCLEHYLWNGSVCKAVSIEDIDCIGKPENAVWNTVDKIRQTWDGEEWYPSSEAVYNTNPSDKECRFICDTDFTWNGTECESTVSNYLPLGRICTGQDKCYNASSSITCPTSSSANFYGQDAQYTSKCTAQSFSSSWAVVVDNNTGLTWEKSPSPDKYTWYESINNATNHCSELNKSNYGGINSWRIPNPMELLTIVDHSTGSQATNSNFTGMPWSSFLWTSQENKSDTRYAYIFSPSSGYYSMDTESSTSYYCKKSETHHILCVSGNEMQPATSADFTRQTINGKVVVTDSKTGLMWQKEYATDKTWQQALAYCQSLNGESYGGYSNWRLPNKNELASLLDPGKSKAPYSNFPDMPSNNFWSSSTANDAKYAWYVRFNIGDVQYYPAEKTSSNNARCVRNAD